MDDKCGFRLHNSLCCCEDMECYGVLCTYMDTIACCPVHFDPSENILDNKKLNMLKVDVLKQEIDDLKVQIILRDKMIDKLAHCVVDPCFGGNL